MSTQKKTTPATPSAAHGRMSPRWDLADSLLGGTEVMRAKGDKYLPQHSNETDEAYQERLQKATLLNMTELTLESLVGQPFSKPIKLEDDVPQTIQDFCEDIDLQGNNIQAFGRAWFREGWAKGLSHVLVDFPVKEEKVGEDGKPIPRTLDDDRKENLRPFASRIRPENVIAAYGEQINGKDVLTHVRILETTVERVLWDEVLVQRIRVLEPGTWAVYKPNDKGDEWTVESEGTTDLDVIPLVTFYAGVREGLHECKPPLMDLMHLNVEHFQSASDQRNVLTVARFPMLAAKGVSSTDSATVGPRRYLTTESVEGEWYYVEHTGAAIAAGEKDLERLRDQMAGYGAQFLKTQPGNETATRRALDSAEGVSYLTATALDFQDALETVLGLFAQWQGEEDGGSVIVHTSFNQGEKAADDLEALIKVRVAKEISGKAFTDELVRRGTLAEDFDFEADQKLLEAEAESAMNSGMGDMFGNGDGTGGNPPPEQIELDPETGKPKVKNAPPQPQPALETEE